ncbi:MAG: exosortase Q [Comamonadaceae bacterium]|nr:MAG: exosortase Q [Comamonadaceae bacterium]
MNRSLLLRSPRILALGVRLDRTPAFGWLALQLAALGPTWVWMGRRMADGSDDPLGALALAALAVLSWQRRRSLSPSPRLGWLAAASIGTVAATLARTGALEALGLPPLAAGLLAVLAMAAGLLAFLPRRSAAAPVLGLAVLALPLLSSMQFYAGYPLRVVTAEASRWLLAPAFDVAREGSSLWIDSRLVIVDAPCSGVQMAWLAYFAACAVALSSGRDDRAFLARLPFVGLLVLTGNVLRNTVLVALEGAGRAPGEALHQAIGLLVLACVCAAVCGLMARGSRPMRHVRSAAASGSIHRSGGRHVDLA